MYWWLAWVGVTRKHILVILLACTGSGKLVGHSHRLEQELADISCVDYRAAVSVTQRRWVPDQVVFGRRPIMILVDVEIEGCNAEVAHSTLVIRQWLHSLLPAGTAVAL